MAAHWPGIVQDTRWPFRDFAQAARGMAAGAQSLKTVVQQLKEGGETQAGGALFADIIQLETVTKRIATNAVYFLRRPFHVTQVLGTVEWTFSPAAWRGPHKGERGELRWSLTLNFGHPDMSPVKKQDLRTNTRYHEHRRDSDDPYPEQMLDFEDCPVMVELAMAQAGPAHRYFYKVSYRLAVCYAGTASVEPLREFYVGNDDAHGDGHGHLHNPSYQLLLPETEALLRTMKGLGPHANHHPCIEVAIAICNFEDLTAEVE